MINFVLSSSSASEHLSCHGYTREQSWAISLTYFNPFNPYMVKMAMPILLIMASWAIPQRTQSRNGKCRVESSLSLRVRPWNPMELWKWQWDALPLEEMQIEILRKKVSCPWSQEIQNGKPAKLPILSLTLWLLDWVQVSPAVLIHTYHYDWQQLIQGEITNSILGVLPIVI